MKDTFAFPKKMVSLKRWIAFKSVLPGTAYYWRGMHGTFNGMPSKNIIALKTTVPMAGVTRTTLRTCFGLRPEYIEWGKLTTTGAARMRHWVVVQDDEGKFIRVADFSRRVDSSDLDDAHGTIASLPDIRTPDGTGVSKLSQGKYKVGDKIFTTNDPYAP